MKYHTQITDGALLNLQADAAAKVEFVADQMDTMLMELLEDGRPLPEIPEGHSLVIRLSIEPDAEIPELEGQPPTQESDVPHPGGPDTPTTT